MPEGQKWVEAEGLPWTFALVPDPSGGWGAQGQCLVDIALITDGSCHSLSTCPMDPRV